ncbi:hypothetical protein AVEN_121148-1 [Araneus ventricosus]|uniref:Uncharacterized protein n=1 Tax=Araneus ventricosus TaxID=182803 RepID=A0A4Y2E376_ARAVE|nr:hypothetical protein AVEN_121148-1 [Araneus ventricosus]
MSLNEIPITCHFSATSHGKSCIDGIGETIQRHVREVSRARKADRRTSLKFANDLKKVCTGINILYESEEQIEAVKAKLDEMWLTNAQEIKGMPGRKAHCFLSYASNVFYSLESNCERGTLFNFRSGDCVEKSGGCVEQSLQGEKNRKSETAVWTVDNVMQLYSMIMKNSTA